MRRAGVLAAVLLAGAWALAQDGAADRAAKAREALARGMERLERNDPAGAIPDLATAVGLDPASVDARVALGLAYFLTDDHARARPEIEAALDREPKHPVALETLGRIEYHDGRLDRALEHLRAAAEASPERGKELAELVAKIEREAAVEATFNEKFTLHFRIRVEGGRAEGRVADEIADALERAYDEVGYALGHFPSRPVTVLLYADQDFAKVTGAHGWVGGIFDEKIRIPIKGALMRSDDSLRRIARHEYVHACVFTIAPRCPTWLQEGLAQHFEGIRFEPGGLIPHRESLPSIASLGGSFVREKDAKAASLLYAQSLGFVQFLLDRRGTGDMGALLRELGAGGELKESFRKVYGEPLEELEERWKATLR